MADREYNFHYNISVFGFDYIQYFGRTKVYCVLLNYGYKECQHIRYSRNKRLFYEKYIFRI